MKLQFNQQWTTTNVKAKVFSRWDFIWLHYKAKVFGTLSNVQSRVEWKGHSSLSKEMKTHIFEHPFLKEISTSVVLGWRMKKRAWERKLFWSFSDCCFLKVTEVNRSPPDSYAEKGWVGELHVTSTLDEACWHLLESEWCLCSSRYEVLGSQAPLKKQSWCWVSFDSIQAVQTS